jgi:hypothetical protein
MLWLEARREILSEIIDYRNGLQFKETYDQMSFTILCSWLGNIRFFTFYV